MRSQNKNLLKGLSFEEKNKLIANTEQYQRLKNNPQKPQYKNSDEERQGFLYHHTCHSLGKLFQNTKTFVIEKTIDQVWKNFIRYKCEGDKQKYREALKDPSIAFRFGEGYVGHIHKLAYKIIESNYTDNDWQRKQGIMKKLADIYCTGIHEDAYYRPLSKLDIKILAEDYLKNPEIYKLNEFEQTHYDTWKDYEYRKENNLPYGNEYKKQLEVNK